MPTHAPVEPVIGRYMDIRTDYAFKTVFGVESNKDILIAFLNDLLEGTKVITDIEYRSVEAIPDRGNNKRIIFDLRCRGENGEEFLIELQRSRQEHFKDRVVFYFSRLISRLLRRGARSNAYKLPEVYVIAIIDFRIDDHVKDRYSRTVALTDVFSHEVFYGKLFLKWLELPNFTKDGRNVVTNIDKWMWLFKNLGSAREMPAFMDTPAMKKVFKITEMAYLKEGQRTAYESRLRNLRDHNSIMSYAREEGARTERERANKAEAKLLQAETERIQAETERIEAETKVAEAEAKAAQAEFEKLNAARAIKKMGILTNLQIARKFKISVKQVEKL